MATIDSIDVTKYSDLPAMGLSGNVSASGPAVYQITGGPTTSANLYFASGTNKVTIKKSAIPSQLNFIAGLVMTGEGISGSSIITNVASDFVANTTILTLSAYTIGNSTVAHYTFTNLSNGLALQLIGIEAVKNVMKMYLLSEIGDYGRTNPTRGGPLFDMVGKPLTETNKQDLATRITNALQQFTNITLNTLDITLDNINKMFVVNLTFSDNYNKLYAGISLGVTGS